MKNFHEPVNGYIHIGKEGSINTFMKKYGNIWYVIKCTDEQLNNGDIEYMTEHGITLSKERIRKEKNKMKKQN